MCSISTRLFLNTLPFTCRYKRWYLGGGREGGRERGSDYTHITLKCITYLCAKHLMMSKGHDSVLQVIADFVRDHLPESFEMSADLPDLPYNFPLMITPTDLRPDIVLWSQTLQSATLVELTVCYETNYVQAQTRKLDKYQDLVDAGEANGFTMEVITLEVGSRGFLNLQGFKALFQTLTRCPRKNTWNFLKTICRITILQSQRIWTTRNIIT